MASHQTKSVTPVTKTAGAFLMKQEIKTGAIILGEEDVLIAVPSEHNMIETAGQMYAWFAYYGKKNTLKSQLVNLEA